MDCLVEMLRECVRPSRNALHHAAANGNVEEVRLLIDRGSYVNLLDQNGHTPVMHAMVYRNIDVLRELVANPSVDLDWNSLGLEDWAT